VKVSTQEGDTFELGERTLTVRHVIDARPTGVNLLVSDGEGDTYLVWSGGPSWARDLEDVIASVDSSIEAVPRVVERHNIEDEVVFLLTAPPETASPFESSTWRALPSPTAVLGLQEFALALLELHRANGWLQGVKRDELWVDLVTAQLYLVGMSRLFVSSKPPVEAAWRDMRFVGELAYENFVEDDYPGGHEMAAILQDRTAMEGTPIIFPGLPQILAGCVSPYGDLAYSDADDLFDGLEQLRIELDRPFGFQVGAASTVGNYLFRKNNQDSCGHILFQGICGSRKVSMGFFCVADGIGGIQDGEHASRLAVETACESFARGWAYYGAEPLIDRPIDFARSIAKVVGQRLALEGEFEPRYNRGGTTFSGMVVAGDRIGVCHVGDSRIVLVRDGEIIPLTQDHTLANILVRLGELTEEEALENDLSQRTISRFLSTATEVETDRIDDFHPEVGTMLDVDVEKAGIEVERGDLFILTSDGAHGEYTDDELHQLIDMHGDDPQALAEACVGRALERMGRDNSTALVVLVE